MWFNPVMPDRIAIIADVHGNSRALKAVLADIERRRADAILNLGDSLYGPLEPAETVGLLMARGIPSVSGNEDRLILEIAGGAPLPPRLAHTMAQMTPAILEWLAGQPRTMSRDGFFLCHGTPVSDTEYLLERVTASGVGLRPAQEVAAMIAAVAGPIVLCGHSHLPRLAQAGGALIVNPGSVGLPAYHDDRPFPHAMEAGSAHARYALLERGGDDWRVEHIALAYDWKAAAAAANRNGRPDWALWLAHGRV
jgi:putative phosphoesterase